MSRSTSASPIVVELSVSYEHLETNVRYALCSTTERSVDDDGVRSTDLMLFSVRTLSLRKLQLPLLAVMADQK